ncbi:hypothetical protein IT575_10505 [bacterium]|nr:hypothetical protein [bacterium]
MNKMKNLTGLLLGAAALSLTAGLCACGGSSGNPQPDTTPAPQPGVREVRRFEERISPAAIRVDAAQGLDLRAFIPSAQRSASASLTQMLPAPQSLGLRRSSGLKSTSDTELVTVFGKDFSQASPGSDAVGETVELVSTATEAAWALFSMPAISTEDQFVARLSVRVSNALFSEGGGYYAAVADFNRQRWDLLNLTQAETYQHSIGITQDLVDPLGVMYLAVILPPGQSMRVEFVRQQREDVVKPWYVVDPNISADHGLSPAAAISLSGVPMAAYINNSDGKAYLLQPDPTSDFNQSEDWPNPQQAMYNLQDASGFDLDLLIDPVIGFPRASLLLNKENSASGKTPALGLTAARLNAQNQLEWLSIELSGVDSGEYTSIARSPASGLYSITSSALNANSPGSGEYDIERREFDIQQLLNIQPVDVSVVKSFGEGLRYPHMRYSLDGREAYAAAGGTVIYEEPADQYLFAYEETGTEPWGSLSFVPATASVSTVFGNTYARNNASGGTLYSAAFADSLIGVEDEVDSISGSGSWIGGVSQIEYQVDGTPCIAYSYCDGTNVGIRFAIMRAGSWQVEDVNEEPMPAQGDHQRIGLDLAVEPPGMFVLPSGRLIIAFEQYNGSSSEIRIAVRQPGF